MRDFLFCAGVVDDGPGYKAPQAARPVDADVSLDDIEIDGLGKAQAPIAAKGRLRPAEWRTPETQRRAALILSILGQCGPMTAREIALHLAAQGVRLTKGQTAHALEILEHERRATSIMLRSARDIARAGGRRLWSV